MAAHKKCVIKPVITGDSEAYFLKCNIGKWSKTAHLRIIIYKGKAAGVYRPAPKGHWLRVAVGWGRG